MTRILEIGFLPIAEFFELRRWCNKNNVAWRVAYADTVNTIMRIWVHNEDHRVYLSLRYNTTDITKSILGAN